MFFHFIWVRINVMNSVFITQILFVYFPSSCFSTCHHYQSRDIIESNNAAHHITIMPRYKIDNRITDWYTRCQLLQPQNQFRWKKWIQLTRDVHFNHSELFFVFSLSSLSSRQAGLIVMYQKKRVRLILCAFPKDKKVIHPPPPILLLVAVF